MVVLKSFGYALNNPAKEMLYLTTSAVSIAYFITAHYSQVTVAQDIKLKAKSWIDMVRYQTAKVVNLTRRHCAVRNPWCKGNWFFS